MKINKITLIVSTLLVAIAAQPAHGMMQNYLQSFKNNPYARYGATLVAGFSLGAGFMYYMTRPTTTTDSLQKTESLIPVALCFKQTKMLDAFCSQEDFQTLQASTQCYVQSINEQELELRINEHKQTVTLYSKPCNVASNKKFDMEFYDFEWKPCIEKVMSIVIQQDSSSNKTKIAFNECI